MSRPTDLLPLPQPWRMIFRDLENLKTDSRQYVRLNSLTDGGKKHLPPDAIEHWNVDQTRASFVATLTDGQRLEAKVQFLGSHDGQTFLWADSNPSIEPRLNLPASTLRNGLPAELASLGQTDKNELDLRSTRVLLALATEVCDCDFAVLMPSNDTYVAMLLSGTKFFRTTPQQKPGFFSRMFGKAPATETNSIEAQLANLRLAVNIAMNQWQKNLLPDEDLRAIEPKLLLACDAMENTNPSKALDILADVQKQMGPYAQDQEPTGWVYLCEGLVPRI